MSNLKDYAPSYVYETATPALIPSTEGSLFTKKEIYKQSHSENGYPLFLKSDLQRPARYRYDNMHLLGGMRMVDFYGIGIPQLDPYDGSVDFEAVPFSKRMKASGHNQAVHFFENDERFRFATWDKLEQTSQSLSRFDVLFTPDFSMYVEEDFSFFGLQAVFKTRFVGAYWQQTCGFKVIPTLSFGNADSLKYSFLGLPRNSVLGVCGVGINRSRSSRILWEYALRVAEVNLSPTLFIVYGAETEVPGLHTPIVFIPDYITSHFCNEKAI